PLRATQAEELLRTGAVALTPEERSLVENADGIRTVARIAAQAGLDAERAQVVAQRLVKTGVLKLQTKRARTARLVARLSQLPIAPGAAGVDVNIVAAWERALERPVRQVACRREDGTVLVFDLQLLDGAGPFLELSRVAFLRADLVANEPLLVRPYVTVGAARAAPARAARGATRPAWPRARARDRPPSPRPGGRARAASCCRGAPCCAPAIGRRCSGLAGRSMSGAGSATGASR